MGQRKQIIISLICLISTAAAGWCFAADFAQDSFQELNEKSDKLQIYFGTEMYSETTELFDELILQFPGEVRFKYPQAIVDYQRGYYQRPQEVFQEFIEQYPEVPEPYYLLSQILINKQDLVGARRYLEKYCQLVPEDYQAHLQLTEQGA